MYLHHNLSTKVKYKVLVSQQTLMLQLESKPLKTGTRHQYPKSEHSCLCWGSCTIFKCSTLEFSGRLQNPSLAFPVQRYPCAGAELCRLPGRAGVTALSEAGRASTLAFCNQASQHLSQESATGSLRLIAGRHLIPSEAKERSQAEGRAVVPALKRLPGRWMHF